MKNEIVSKINKIGKIGQIISNICKVLLVIGIVGCVIGAAVLAVFPKDFITISLNGDAVVDVNFKSVPILSDFDLNEIEAYEDFDADFEGEFIINGMSYGMVDMQQTDKGLSMLAKGKVQEIHITSFVNIIVSAIVYIISALVVLHFIGHLCKTFRYCETPFTDEIVTAIKRLAFSIIPMALLSSVADALANYVLTDKVDFVLNIDLTTVILVILIFLLAAIFNYGTMLQKESDETL